MPDFLFELELGRSLHADERLVEPATRRIEFV
jgi:hypothetical protein